MRCFGIPDPAIPTSSYQTVLEPTKPNKTLPFPTTHHQSSCAASPSQKHFLYFHLPFLRMRHQSRTVGPLLETDAADTKRCLRGLAHKQAGWLAGGVAEERRGDRWGMVRGRLGKSDWRMTTVARKPCDLIELHRNWTAIALPYTATRMQLCCCALWHGRRSKQLDCYGLMVSEAPMQPHCDCIAKALPLPCATALYAAAAWQLKRTQGSSHHRNTSSKGKYPPNRGRSSEAP